MHPFPALRRRAATEISPFKPLPTRENNGLKNEVGLRFAGIQYCVFAVPVESIRHQHDN